MYFAIRAAGDETAGAAILREVVAEVDGKLATDFARGGIDQDSGKGLGG